MRIACFDIDGTLIDSAGAGRRAIHRALLEVLGTAGPIADFRFDGRTDGEIVSRLAEGAGLGSDGETVNRVLERYLVFLDEELSRPGHRTRLLPGVAELLDALEASGSCLLGLLTGNIVDGARLKLESAHLPPGRFRLGAYGSDSHVRAELPEVARRRAEELLRRQVAGSDLVIIGDTPADMTCGRSIGARAVGTATAAYRVEDLLASGAAAAFADLSDTAAVTAAILGQ